MTQSFQGDISIIPMSLKVIEKAFNLASLKWKKTNELIVAMGETTGHSHRVIAKEKMEYIETPFGFIVRPQSDGELVHEEHEKHVIKKQEGDIVYWIGRQYEYDALDKYRQVQD